MTTWHAPAPVDQVVLDDLRRRLAATRLLPGVPGGWDRGTDATYLADLIEYWRDDYDWRAAEGRIRNLPWVRASNGVRLVEQRASDPDAPTVVLLHGWPDSVLRFTRVLPLLTEMHVLVPALPGYPFSDAPGGSREAMAVPIAEALAELGHDRYVVSGGDIGSGVAVALAGSQPEHVAALHLTDLPLALLTTVEPGDRTPAEREYGDEIDRWRAAEGAYSAQQGTKPNTLAAALGDSPAGLAAWIVEKLRAWSDCGGDVESVFPRDDLLTWITAYWVTGAIGTSFTPYAEREPPRPGRIDLPTVVTIFPRELVHPPRHLAERIFDVRAWDEQPSGGHFAAWERPDAFAAGVHAAVAAAGSR